PIPANWNYDQFAEISGYHDKWDLDRVAYSGKVAPCDFVLPESVNDPLYKWAWGTEEECISGMRVVCQMLVSGSGYEGGHRLESVKAKNN
ncbi:hypothetical protein CQR46_1708, partial [Bifidobacterium pseudolongum subsp. globosum]